MVGNGVFAHYVGVDLVGREHQWIGPYIAGYHLFAVLRVKNLNFFYRDMEHVGNLLEMDSPFDVHGVGQYGPFCQGGGYVVFVVVVHHIVRGDEAWHISACFRRQVWIDCPEIFLFSLATAEGFVDVAWAAVVGGDCQRPIVVDVVELA